MTFLFIVYILLSESAAVFDRLPSEYSYLTKFSILELYIVIIQQLK